MANDKKAWPHSSMSDVLASHIKAALNPGLPPGLSEKLRSSPQQITTGLQRLPCKYKKPTKVDYPKHQPPMTQPPTLQLSFLHILKQLAVLPMPHVGPQPAHATERQGDGQQETGAESHQGEPAADV